MRSHQSTSLVLSIPQLRNNIQIVHTLSIDHFGSYRIHKGRQEDLISFLVSNAISTLCTALVLSLRGHRNNNWMLHSSFIDPLLSYRSRWGRLNNLISSLVSPPLVLASSEEKADQRVPPFCLLLWFSKWPSFCCRHNWTKVVDCLTESARSMSSEAMKGLKKFLNAELAGTSWPSAAFAGMWQRIRDVM